MQNCCGNDYINLSMIDQKTSANKTGTLFYTKVGDGNKPYRVRFRSFQQGLFENRGLI